jgi:hypothetical protein
MLTTSNSGRSMPIQSRGTGTRRRSVGAESRSSYVLRCCSISRRHRGGFLCGLGWSRIMARLVAYVSALLAVSRAI